MSFPEWRALLDLEALETQVRWRHAQAIMRYLHHCKTDGKRASIADAKRYLDGGRADGRLGPVDREALHWFFVTAQRRHGGRDRAAVATLRMPKEGASADVAPPTPRPIPPGTPAWEEKFIRTMRLRGFLWNSEQIYRGWLRRYAARIAPVLPDQAGPDEVRAFLSDLAVQRQVAESTQRQALNALVFFYQEALQRDLGDLGAYHRARRSPKVPVVLSRAEIDRLFAQMDGTWLLMAQVQYGSGLRVSELVELRVQSLDLDRGRVLVFGGKGNRVEDFVPRGSRAVR